MNLKDLYTEFELCLSSIYSTNEIEILYKTVLEHGLNISRQMLLLEPMRVLKLEEQKYVENVLVGLQKGNPIQHLLESVYFYKYHFKVNDQTLIPRPETEELVDLIIKDSNHFSGRILDVGTGSGCIAICLKKEFLQSTVRATDISETALLIAKENAQKNKAEVFFEKIDFLKSQDKLEEFKIDLIVSNPPYIGMSEKNDMHKRVVDYEPHSALFVPDENPFLFYEAIQRYAKQNLKEDGRIFLEINQKYGEETKRIFTSNNWQVKLYKDLSSNDRFLKIWA